MAQGPQVRAVVAEAVETLRAAGVADAVGDARRLLAHALGIAPARLTLHLDDPVEAPAAEAFAALVAARAARAPVSQLVGRRQFWGRDFLVTPDVLDPRPETETLVAAALEAPFATVLDLGTGSGCLLVTLLAERPGATGVGIDLSPAALRVAEANARRVGVEGKAAFRPGDWMAGVEERFDLIVANPPYIAAADMADLMPEVRDHEPHMALTDGGDGLGAYRVILRDAGDRLGPGGRLAVEVGAGQAGAVLALAEAAGWPPGETRADLDGRERVVLWRRPADPA